MCAVTKVLPIIYYPTVIMNEKKSVKRKRDSIERRRIFQLRSLFDMEHNMYALRSNTYY